MPNDEIDHWRDGDRAEKSAALASLVVVHAAGIGMMMARSVLVDVDRADPVFVVIQAMRRQGLCTERQHGRRGRQTQRIKRDKSDCRAPTPFSG